VTWRSGIHTRRWIGDADELRLSRWIEATAREL
jgi:hypothetical protein